MAGRGSTWRAVWSEALASLGQKPARTVLTMLGTVLGVGCFVAVLGLTATAAGQISTDFSSQIATAVRVNDAGTNPAGDTVFSFPDDAEQRIARLNGVQAGGVAWSTSADLDLGPAASSPAEAARVTVTLATSGYIDALLPTWRSGGVYNRFQQDHRLPVVVLGPALANRFGLSQAGGVVQLNGLPYLVTGILADVATQPEVLAGALIPATTGWDRFGSPTVHAPASMLIRTDLGAAHQIAGEAARQLRPDAPQLMAVVPPPDPPRMASLINASMRNLFTALAGLTLLIGGAAIANTTLVSVMERTQEIGLRRALGAAPAHIIAQFLIETVVLGAVAGLVGGSLGLLAVIAVALSLDWTALIDPWIVLAAPAIGAGVGLLAGLYPAWKAGHIDPIGALRR
ncbi:MAG: ABC transporter permease [Propionibacteriaceae bacterium]|jgi:putative ABC transport system permease protein|nr:ABC transporter permease [Propionibacteriaceae bacterium]